jgi:hypothetical protein
MEKEGGFINRPPLLDGTNYDYWKSRISAYLKSIDSKTWKAVMKGWEHPVVLDKDDNKTTVLKPEDDWTLPEDELALANSKALNALFNGVDKNMFRLIKKCDVAKDAWDILKTAHEGTSKVKSSRIQLLTTKFESLRMQEDETIQDYYMNVLDIANSFDSLGEKLSDEKLVRKILRSLPKRFDMKVTAIEEAQDVSNMQVEELIGSLQNFELVVDNRSEKKGKGIAFTANTADDEGLEEGMEDENLPEDFVMLGRQFNKILKQVSSRSRGNGWNIRWNTDRQQANQKYEKNDEKNSRYKGVQCHECEGYGHIRTECATFLKKQKKGMIVSWSDDEGTDRDVESDAAKRVSAMTGRVEPKSKNEDSDSEKVTVSCGQDIHEDNTSRRMME